MTQSDTKQHKDAESAESKTAVAYIDIPGADAPLQAEVAHKIVNKSKTLLYFTGRSDGPDIELPVSGGVLARSELAQNLIDAHVYDDLDIVEDGHRDMQHAVMTDGGRGVYSIDELTEHLESVDGHVAYELHPASNSVIDSWEPCATTRDEYYRLTDEPQSYSPRCSCGKVFSSWGQACRHAQANGGEGQ